MRSAKLIKKCKGVSAKFVISSLAFFLVFAQVLALSYTTLRVNLSYTKYVEQESARNYANNFSSFTRPEIPHKVRDFGANIDPCPTSIGRLLRSGPYAEKILARSCQLDFIKNYSGVIAFFPDGSVWTNTFGVKDNTYLSEREALLKLYRNGEDYGKVVVSNIYSSNVYYGSAVHLVSVVFVLPTSIGDIVYILDMDRDLAYTVLDSFAIDSYKDTFSSRSVVPVSKALTGGSSVITVDNFVSYLFSTSYLNSLELVRRHTWNIFILSNISGFALALIAAMVFWFCLRYFFSCVEDLIIGVLNRETPKSVLWRLFSEGRLILFKALMRMRINSRNFSKRYKEFYEDSLTRLYNRSMLSTIIKKNLHGTVILLDLDNFKSTNDNYGHLVGDSLLSLIGQAILNIVGNKCMGFRYGGDEFIIFHPTNSGMTSSVSLANRLKELIETLGKPYGVTVSIGLASGEFNENLIKDADQQLYEAKSAGKSQIFYKN